MDVSKLSIENDRVTHKKTINNRYRIIRKVGEGQFGKVLLALDTTNNEDVAIKTINRIDKKKLITKTYLNQATKIKREIQIMKECSHPNVVKLFSVIDDLKYDKILLVLEYCQYGEIDWKRYNHYNEKYFKEDGLTLNRILRDVVNGLDYLHNYKRIIHRDLKPSNLLISRDRTIKISDFGVSLILENNANDQKELGKTMGTPAFYAPELCQFVNNRLSMIEDISKSKTLIDLRIDIWSLGVVLYCLEFHELPFNGFNEYGLFKNIVNKTLTFPSTKHVKRTTDGDVKELDYLKDLITRLLMKDPNKRITIDEIKVHPFILYDLSPQQAEEFKNFNRNTVKKTYEGLTNKIRKLFVSKAPARIEDTESYIAQENLEPVDELLDSYLDSSSESEYEEEGEQVESIKRLPPPLELIPPPTFGESRTGLRSNRSSSLSNSFASSPVTVGAASPSSQLSLFSPSKRFFSRRQKTKKVEPPQPTISSLSSPTSDNYTMEPPAVFGSNNLSSSCSRKNSMISQRSGGGLSRITSSNSSLNLNMYLTDDTLSLHTSSGGSRASRASRDSGVSRNSVSGADDTMSNHDDTVTYEDRLPEVGRHFDMSRYLDLLDGGIS